MNDVALWRKLGKSKRLVLWLILICRGANFASMAQTTAFTYQGELQSNGVAAQGSYDLKFTCYNAANGGTVIGSTTTNKAVPVSGGIFTTPLDFGSGVFTGGQVWMEIAVSVASSNSFTTLAPRQQVTVAPYALYALSAGTAASNSSTAALPAAQITGTIGTAQLGNAILAHSGTGNDTTLSNVNLQAGGSWTGDSSGNSFTFTSMNNLTGPVILQDSAPIAFTAMVGKTDGDAFEWAIGTGNSGVGQTYGNRMFIASTAGPSDINTNNGGWGQDIVTSIEGNDGISYDHVGYWFFRNFANQSLDQAILAPNYHNRGDNAGSLKGLGWASIYVDGRSGNVTLTNGTTTISNATILGNLTLLNKDSFTGQFSVTNLDATVTTLKLSTNLIPAGAAYVNGTGEFAGFSVYQIPATLNSSFQYVLNVTNSLENSEVSLTDLATESFSPVQKGTNLVQFNTTGYNNPFLLVDVNGNDLTGHPVTYGIYQILGTTTNTSFNNLAATSLTLANPLILLTNSPFPSSMNGAGMFATSNYDLYWVTPTKTNLVALGH
jgi:hypothetical protein